MTPALQARAILSKGDPARSVLEWLRAEAPIRPANAELVAVETYGVSLQCAELLLSGEETAPFEAAAALLGSLVTASPGSGVVITMVRRAAVSPLVSMRLAAVHALRRLPPGEAKVPLEVLAVEDGSAFVRNAARLALHEHFPPEPEPIVLPVSKAMAKAR